ncbi:MAG TPA: hypothetical protein VGH27_13345 [Streptosporangiaceae bacterium]
MSLSCGGPGDCSAGGYYTDGNSSQQAFVVNQNDGTWGTADEVPGTATLNTGGDARLDSVSCSSAGNCGASGSYTSSSGSEGFVVAQTNGTCGTAQSVPQVNGIGALSCTSAGNCSAGASYEGAIGESDAYQAFVVTETDGTWGTPKELPGIAALASGGDSFVAALSCSTAGDRSVGGDYTTNGISGGMQAYVANEVNGTWRDVEDVPGTSQGTASEGGGSSIASMSCVSGARCVADGSNPDSTGAEQTFVVNRT